MIRALLISSESIPPSLHALLEKSGEIEVARDTISPDLLVFYTALWNRSARDQYESALRKANVPAVVVCDRAEEPFATDSILRNEIAAVLQTNSTNKQFLAGLYAAVAGWRLLPQKKNLPQTASSVPSLTPRELEVLRLIADGEGNKTIAYLLGISEHTVKFHIASIFEKLDVSSRTEAVKAGIHNGLIAL